MISPFGCRDSATREAAVFARNALVSLAAEAHDPVRRSFLEAAGRHLDALLSDAHTPADALRQSGPYLKGKSLVELLLVDPFAEDHLKLAKALIRTLPWDGL